MKVCFFSTDAKLAKFQQYLIQDIDILNDFGFEVHVTSNIFDLFYPRYDLYFSWWATGSSLSILASKIYGKKSIAILGGNECVYYIDSVTGIPFGYLAYPWYKKIAVKYTLRNADVAVAVSNFMVNHVRKISGKVPMVCYNTVDRNIFNEQVSQPKDPALTHKYVMTIANFEKIPYEVKRIENLLTSFAIIVDRFPDLKLLILGRRGDAYNTFRKKIKSLNLSKHVIDIGMVENSHIPDLLRNSSAYIQVSDTETFGQSVVEAMSCGVPVVVSTRGALPEICGDFAMYVDHNSPKSISEGLLKVLCLNEVDINIYSANVKKHIEANFTRSTRKGFFEKIFTNLGLI